MGQEAFQAAPRPNSARVAPLAPQRYGVQFTLDQAGHDLLRHVQDLLGHQVAPGDIADVFVRALRVYAAQLEKQRFAATEQPRAGRCPRPGSRHIPAQVKRAVWERDNGQCTFVSQSGHRCEARSELEYDHIQEFARGGEATVEGIRLRCRAHNQYTAERTFGAAFMSHKREEARGARAEMKARQAASPAPRVADGSHEDLDVIPWLRGLGYSAAEARRADAQCEYGPEASLEERLRLALRQLLPAHRKIAFSPATAS